MEGGHMILEQSPQLLDGGSALAIVLGAGENTLLLCNPLGPTLCPYAS